MFELFVKVCFKMAQAVAMWRIRKYFVDTIDETLLMIRESGEDIWLEELASMILNDLTML